MVNQNDPDGENEMNADDQMMNDLQGEMAAMQHYNKMLAVVNGAGGGLKSEADDATTTDADTNNDDKSKLFSLGKNSDALAQVPHFNLI